LRRLCESSEGSKILDLRGVKLFCFELPASVASAVLTMDQNTLIASIAVVVVAVVTILFYSSSSKANEILEEQQVEKVAPEKKTFTAAEVSSHNKEEDAWIIVDGKVYDITYYGTIHPGGEAIYKNIGGDASAGENELSC
jgi:uncharacterized protein YacL